MDDKVRPELEATLAGCEMLAQSSGTRISTRLIDADFPEWATERVGTLPLGLEPEMFDIAIMNPPYRKVNVSGYERRALQSIEVEITNLYVGFVAMAIALLNPRGQIAELVDNSETTRVI